MTSFMNLARAEAEAAAARGEVPVGAVLVDAGGTLLARAGNRTVRDRDPTAHAEIVAIRRAAAALGSERLVDCDVYVTLEPCAMCAGAISFARIRRLYYGASDPKGGAVEHGVDGALGGNPHVAGEPAHQELADLARAPMRLLAFKPDDQALDRLRQLVGIAHRPP